MTNLDEAFGLLANERRRRAIRYCVDQDEPVNLGELARHIAAREQECAPGSVTSGQRQNVYVALYQTHLAKLSAADIVAWDKRDGIVEARPRAAQLCRRVNQFESEGLVGQMRTMVGSVW